jgi:putative ABC transport system permease protein
MRLLEQIWLRRIVREIIANRSRTALTVLSIAVGLFAVSLTFRTQAILSRNVLDFYPSTVPAAIIAQVQPVDRQLTSTIRRIPGVRAVEGLSHISARVRVGTTWRALALNGVDDISSMQVNRLLPDSGAWPAPKRSMLIERSYLDSAGIQLGDTPAIKLENGQEYQLPVAGSAHDLAVVSGRLGSAVLHGYISLDTAEWLTGSRDVNEFQIAVDDDQRDTAHLRALVERVRAELTDAGCTIVYIRVRDPAVPESYAILKAVFQTLIALGTLSLLLSACLVVNTTSALLTRHVPQIGIMKAIGARTQDIFVTYLSIVLLIAVIALLIALPAAALCAQLLATQLAWLLNYTIQDVQVPLGVVALELAAGIITPLLASLYPVSAAAGVTVREALGSVQAGAAGARTQLRTPIPGVPIALLYAARSMFRRKARLILTLAALMCGGAIEITVISTQASLSATLDQVAAYWQQDLTVTFDRLQPSTRVTSEAMQVPGVVGVEHQPAALAVRRRANGSESEDRYAIYGVLPASALLRPTLLQGRWLAPDDTDAIVVNVDLLKRELDLAPGDRLALTINGRTTTWQIVGVVTTHLLIFGDSTIDQGVGYISESAFTQQITRSLRTNRIIVSTSQHDAAFQAQAGKALEAHFAQLGIQALVQTRSDIRGQITSFVSLIVVLLLVMGLSFVAIGALSLIGAMSLNVLERTKEIGILRAIGSSHRHITSIVVIEGACIGLLSWVPATLLALPLSKLLSDVLGWSIVSWPLVYVFPPVAPLLWLGVVGLLSACASYIPARRAAQINVRDALEYQ